MNFKTFSGCPGCGADGTVVAMNPMDDSVHFTFGCGGYGYASKIELTTTGKFKKFECRSTKTRVERPSWDEYFMHLAVIAATRGTCDRRRVGCVIVSSSRQVVSTGYNGSAPGAQHCDDVGHLLHDGHCVRTIHAERNAIAQAARQGSSTDGCALYVTTHPCPSCLVLLPVAGIRRIVFLEPYHGEEDEVSAVLAMGAGLELIQYEGRKSWESPIVR